MSGSKEYRAWQRMRTHAGRTQPIGFWAKEAGLPTDCILMRLKRGWPMDAALTMPKQRGGTGKPRWSHG